VVRVLTLGLTLCACSAATQSTPMPDARAAAHDGPAGGAPRVLFVGNSLTSVNDVPGSVRALAAAAGAPLTVDAVTLDGASLGDHLVDGTATRRLSSERWDFVVLQQGPSSRPDSRVALRADTASFAALDQAAGARTALYMVWAIQSEPEWFDSVRDSYRLAAEDVGGIFLPAGEAWRAAWRIDPSLALYSADGLHPTPAGSYAAALVIAAGLTGRSPIGLPTLGIDAGVAATLQSAAAETIATFPIGP
jgi:hypothetical protein